MIVSQFDGLDRSISGAQIVTFEMILPRDSILVCTLNLARIFVLAFVLAGCGPESSEVDYVARLGDRYLTREDLDSALESLTVLQDSAEAAEQIMEQWITDELLFREAVRRGLRNQEGVQSLLLENERSVLVSALLTELYKEEDSTPDDQDLLTYYEQNKDQLKLTEPFVKIRYLVTESADSAMSAVELMEGIESSPNPDSAWKAVANRFTEDPDGTTTLSASFYPETRLLSSIPGLNTAVQRLAPGQILSPFELDSRYHIVQLVERIPVGTTPEVALLEDQLRARIAIENRKQLYARQVQRLRNEALAREELDIK
ncbi:MAG: peptidyl-prolyl cis-trans isomerase [Bacteroidetes bacterium]|nr:peptidyl-prolyl cis-trans isomerase [Bacteroidota bacterium]